MRRGNFRLKLLTSGGQDSCRRISGHRECRVCWVDGGSSELSVGDWSDRRLESVDRGGCQKMLSAIIPVDERKENRGEIVRLLVFLPLFLSSTRLIALPTAVC